MTSRLKGVSSSSSSSFPSSSSSSSSSSSFSSSSSSASSSSNPPNAAVASATLKVGTQLLLSQLSSLFAAQLYSSVVTLAGIVICDTKSEVSPYLYELQIFMADSLKELKEYQRAAQLYEQSLQTLKNPRTSRVKSTLQLQIEICLKTATCFHLAKRPRLALYALEKIPPKQRDSQVHLKIARLSEELGEKRAAIEAYKEVLNEQPFAVEIYQALMALGADAELLLIQHGEKLAKMAPWIVSLLNSHKELQRFEYKASFNQLAKLEERFKGSLPLLLSMANCAFKQVNMKESYNLYSKIHATNRFVLESMDQFAAIVKFNGHISEVNILAEELLEVNSDRPEPWLVMARYCEMKGEQEKALTLTERAIKLRPRYANSYLLKGSLMLSTKPSEALQAFHTAYEISPDLDATRGLVEAYSALSRFNDALLLAKETLQKYPRNARALVLIGNLLSHKPESREKAKKALQNSLAIDPHSLEAMVTLVAVLVAEGKTDEATKLLLESLEKNNSDYLHTRLADIYALNSDYKRALEHYGISLSFNPHNARALEGIKRVEQLIPQEDGLAEDEEDPDDDMDE